MKKYRHLFFDLDRTLWDFESNSVLALEEIFAKKKIGEISGALFHDFHVFYKDYNHHLWDLYKHGKVKKEFLRVERFRGALKHFGIESEELAEQVAQDYVNISPQKTKLFPNSIEVVSQLSRKYQLHIITNGFSEVQFIKLEKSGLSPFFTHVITSEMVGVQKPHGQVFQYSLEKAGALTEDSLMIGDDQDSDIRGAREMGIDQVFVDYRHEELIGKPTYHIHELKSLLDFL
jgi:putative hydrolase of the HAD superfamily